MANKKNKFFAVSASAALVASAIVPVAASASYNDESSIASWATESVNYVTEKGFMQGNNGNFDPQGTFTRAQAAVVAVKVLGLDTTKEFEPTFGDVKEGQWFFEEVSAAAEAEIIKGSNGNFRPNDKLTRQEAAVILTKIYGLDVETADVTVLDQFSDKESIASYATKYLAALVEADVMKGSNGKLNPTGNIARQELAVMLAKADQNLGVVAPEDEELVKALEALEEAVAAVEAIGEVTVENAEEAQAAVDALNEAIAAVEAFELAPEDEDILGLIEAVKEIAAEAQAAIDALEVAVESAIALNETTIEVTFTDGTVVEYELDEPLVEGENELIIERDGIEYTVIVEYAVAGELAVESVSAITKTSVTVTLKDAVTEVKAEDFEVKVNGEAVTVSAVAKNLGDTTGKTYNLTIPTLDKKSGELTVNGIAKAFDYEGPAITEVKSLNNKQIEVTFSEKVDKTTAENVTNYGLYANGAAGAKLVTLTADDGGDATTGVIKALAKQTADNKVVITLGSINADVEGYVLNGLTNANYLLYVNNVADASTDKNVIVAQSNAEFKGTTAPDATPAQVLSATYNNGTGKLAISFDKSMKVDTANVDATKIKITDGTTTVALTAADVEGLQLADGTTPAGATTVSNGATITVKAATKTKLDALGTNLSLVLEEGAFKDATNSNNSAAVTKELTVAVSPLVTSATYNEETNVLTLNFNIDIDVAKIASLSGITVGGQAIGSSATVKTTTNGKVVEIQLDAAQAATMEATAGLNTNTVDKTTVVVPQNLFTKVGATTADPGLNAGATLANQAVVQDVTAPTVTATLTGLNTGVGTLTLTGSEALSTTVAGPTTIKFYAADNLTTALGALNVADTTLTRVGTSNSYTLDLSTNSDTLATAIKGAVDANKKIVMVVGKGAIKDANLTDIEEVKTTAPIAVSVAEATYGQTPDTFAVGTVSPNLVTVTFKKTAADVQLNKAVAEVASNYEFVSIANPNVKVAVSAANYVWSGTTGELRLTPATPLVAGAYKLTLKGLTTNAGVKVDDAADTTSDNLVTINPVTIATETVAPYLVAADGTTKANNDGQIALTDADDSGSVTAGDKITIKFSEPVKLTNAKGSDFTVSGGRTLGSSGVAIDPTDNTKVVITLASDATIKLADTITVKVTDAITDLNGNKVSATATDVTTAGLAKPSTVKAPLIKTVKYEDTNKDGVVSQGDKLLVEFDSNVKAESTADLKNDIKVGSATFSAATLENNVLTLTIDTPDTIAVGVSADIDTSSSSANVDIKNSWGDKVVTSAKNIAAIDTVAPKLTGFTYTKTTDATPKYYLTVHFDEAVNTSDSAAGLYNKLKGDNATVITDQTVTAATLSEDKKSVQLELDKSLPIDAFVKLSVSAGEISGITDASGNKAVRNQGEAYSVEIK